MGSDTMADSNIDCNASDLLCTETNSLCCFDGPDWVTPDDQTHSNRTQEIGIKRNRSEPSIGLPLLSEEGFFSMFKAESEHLPRDDYLSRLRSGDLDMSVRKEALDWISKTQAYYNFGPLSICLSMNYLDRFLSVHELPREKSWTVQLLAVACLSIAVKVEETVVPLNVDLQFMSSKEEEPKFVFEGKDIQRMELLLMSTLKWRMQASTPFTFIDYFLRNMNKDIEGFEPSPIMISRSVEIILSTVKGIDFLEFKPSEIAAAVSMFVLEEDDHVEFKAMSFSSLILNLDKGRVLKCFEVIKDLLRMISRSSATAAAVVVPESPNGVLEGGACLSHKSDAANNSSISPSKLNQNMNNGHLLLHPTS
ncbi:cyclin-D4-1-like [Impatiens glandulifera]|uniref:cyclin-D4-1-like n=1 Tax=Impatiens glandulifera TaxID=253017 RepID=UPI001FB12E86|nr:cyclin-D4-1-like [Impatiens glandulifera]